MALIKKVDFRGVEAEYWAIIRSGWDKKTNTTTCTLGLFFNRQTRLDNINNFLNVKMFKFDGELDREQMYTKIKEPIIRKQRNEDGEEVDVDINIFTDSEND